MVKKRVRWKNIRGNKCSLSLRRVCLRLIFYRLSSKEAWQPQALIFHLQTHSFPHFAGAAIPFQMLCVFFHRKLYSTFFMENAELTAELGEKPKAAQCRCWNSPSLQSCAYQTSRTQHHRDPAPPAAPGLGTGQDYAPICNSTDTII